MTTTSRLGITLPDDSTNATTQFFIDRYNEIDDNAAKKIDLDDHIAQTDNPHSVTKSQVGLGNADNTSDLDKPVSTAVALQLVNKEPTSSFSTVAQALTLLNGANGAASMKAIKARDKIIVTIFFNVIRALQTQADFAILPDGYHPPGMIMLTIPNSAHPSDSSYDMAFRLHTDGTLTMYPRGANADANGMYYGMYTFMKEASA
ncbi:MAG: hypothetical protein ACE3JK_01485 [Sporolactobacillus sp.]